VELTIRRPATPGLVAVKAVFRARRPDSKEGGVTLHLGEEIINTYPVAFFVVGLAVLFLRLSDPNAWLLALMFGGFIAIPIYGESLAGLAPALRVFAMAYRAIFNTMVSPLFYFFFAVFPARSPLDRRLPWLKWIFLVLGAGLIFLLLQEADLLPVLYLGKAAGSHTERIFISAFLYGLLGLGLLSLLCNALSTTTQEARRKIRVIFWGTMVGVVPAALALGASDFFGFHMPLLLATAIVILLWLFPLSFAYAVVKHRVLEVPVLLRRGMRYLLVQRGFTILLSLSSIGVTLLFALFFSRYLERLTQAAMPGGIALGTGFGILLLWTGARVHKGVGEKIDRAFFRNAYDARNILQDLAEKTLTASDRQELAALLEHHLKQAFQPCSFAVYLETKDNQLSALGGDVSPELKTISRAQPLLARLALHAQKYRDAGGACTYEISGDSRAEEQGPFLLAPLQPDCLVPILGRDGRIAGLLVLGSRLSEESYSKEDQHLLTSVASQTGVALESIRLAEEIAERMDAERRVAQEMEFARQVQARLFPQKLPPLETLEYAGRCIQASQVGGDYYDFLDLGPGRVGLVLADVAGKGISGALLMANLQANLRSQYAVALDDLPRLLKSVNQLFYQNTADSSYATLFFGDYEDSRRLLRYVNCGHLPALLVHAADAEPTVETLSSTSTVVGLFENWECSVAEVKLSAGDILVLYTDGVTEAASPMGEEFGVGRLKKLLMARRDLPVSSLLETIVAAVEEFSLHQQADDITLVVARCKH
jgi:sigma-B regulation protein RsbU (phosphoserine phosphatase)